jgi:formiminotetrahydrofolate cyclodeaminase
MTDSEVIDAVQKAQRAYASAVTRAKRAHQRVASAAFSFFGSTDVEQAARNNAIHRAELTRSEAIERASDGRRAALAAIRANAGAWADLVPEAA